MPLYEYRCPGYMCDTTVTLWRSITNRDDPAYCPDCACDPANRCCETMRRTTAIPALHGSPNMPNG